MLWTLELPTTYFLEQLVRRTNVNLFHIEPKYSENLLANMCLKLDDIWLFRRIFNKMKSQNEETLKNLICISVNLDSRRMFPLQICINYLNKKIIDYKSVKHEKQAFLKMKLILDFYPKSLMNPTRILDSILESNGICANNTCFIELIMSYIHHNYNLDKFQEQLSNTFMKTIEYKQIKFSKILLRYMKVNKENQKNYLHKSLDCKNIDLLLEFIKLGYDLSQIVYPYGLLELALEKDNLSLYQKLTKQMKYRYHIWHEKKQVEINNHYIVIPKYHRALHYACLYQSSKIINYLCETLGDSLEYKGLCSISPIDLVQKAVYEFCVPDRFVNELIAPKINFAQFTREDTLCQKECCICLEDFYNKSLVVLECGHAFHKTCLQKNLETSPHCPYCRSEVIYKNKCEAKLAILLPKNTKKNKISYSECHQEEKNKYQKPKVSLTYEDKDDYHVIVKQEMIDFQTEIQSQKHAYFLEQIGLVEENIKINNLRFLLQTKKIGHPKNRRMKVKYNLDFDGQYVPPNSPVLKNKNKITQENLLRKYNIDINNIMTGKRNTRNQTPIY